LRRLLESWCGVSTELAVVGGPLAALDRARAAIEVATSLSELKAIRDQAVAVRHYVRAARLGKGMADRCVEIRLRAERRAGEMLAEAGPDHGGDRRSVSRSHAATLNDLDLNKSQSSRWQRLAEVPTDTFESYLASATESDKELTAAGLGKLVRQATKAVRVAKIADTPVADLGGETFPVLLADPPWRYDFATDPGRAIENHYPTMTNADIAELVVPAADDAVLFCWATSPKLREALEVIDAWGFTYKTSMVWVKDKIGMGYYARQQHELLLICTRGSLPVPDPANRPSSVIQGRRELHSAKPLVVHETVERMYPGYRRCELFGRSPRDGWVVWGNQSAGAA